ncbi:BREX-1 system adenine-specific DNA-methyltransferase PglX [Thermococcus aggregans]|uniref:site-specific DNA-methyltransferase (adenine-specific) n=1 Tax=Thermococcus aggregans TaxID=110163 RepID=A0A9E7MZE0_THEAG|nr:DNA methyltransferase [Thermococcus aggregans]USS41572.1 BREX-1 system adenine-specific DNA-methyltransferase PglX [Thermococcus aggregans]
MEVELKDRVKNILENLKPKMRADDAINIFRDIFVDVWGFDYHDEPIPEGELNEFVAQNTRMIKIIAKTNPPEGDSFYIVYAQSRSDTVKYRQRMVKDLLNFTYSPGLEFANFLIILDYDGYWKLVVPIYRRELENAKLNIYVIDPEEKKFRTLVENLAAVAEELKKFKEHPSAIQIKAIIDEYMQVKPLTEEFFKEYKEYYYKLKGEIKKLYGKKLEEVYMGELPKEIFVERAAKTFAHTFFNRLMFVYFLQKKGWIVEKSALRKDLQEKVNVKNFVRWLHDQWEEHGGELYRDYLRVLFLYAMNTPRVGYERRNVKEIQNIPSPIVRDVFTYGVPYFNGGLFSHVKIEDIDLDEIITSLPNVLVRELIFNFFEEYNFTVTEETPYEVEVAVDPAMLGKIYESLIAEEEKALEEEERRVSGIFYTPRAEVDFMCRMAIYEYLRRNTKVDDKLLREFVFKPVHEWEPRSLPWEIVEALEEVKIVDPAAGSGAFLVGMYHLLTELYEKANVSVDYKKKLEIIRENIYGVDIKEWAIRVAKLRLWLALIEKEERIPNEPILPNLEAKLVVGDSLAPPHIIIKGEDGKKIVLDIPLSKWRESLKQRAARSGPAFWIVQYKELAKKYYEGRGVSWKDLEETKWHVLEAFAEDVLEELKDSRETKDKKAFKLLLSAIREGRIEKPPFIWELDFPEVMLYKKGFDIVIANPPYVRQEKIYPEYYDLAEFEMLSKKEQEKLKKEYKEKIINHMETIIKEKFEHEMKLNKRSDLYAYFFIQGVNLLNPKGVLVFITSNSWLDVDYGTQLQEFFLRFTNLRRIIDYTTRSFEQADVNTVITVLTRKPKELFNTIGEECVNFILLKKNFDELSLEIINKMLDCYVGKVKEVEVFGGKVYSHEDDDVRVRSVKAVDLAKMGGLEIGKRSMLLGTYNIFGEYKGMKWGGILIRAPQIFHIALERGKNKIILLETAADTKFGIKTGANEFFYLTPIKTSEDLKRAINNAEKVLRDLKKKPKENAKVIEELKHIIENITKGVCPVCGKSHQGVDEYVWVYSSSGWIGYLEKEFLKPVITNTREISTYLISPSTPSKVMFYCHLSREELEKRGLVHAKEYIKWGELRGYNTRRSVQGRKYWWALPIQEKQDFIVLRFRDQRNWTPILPEDVQIYAGDVVFVGIYKEKYKSKKKVLDAVLNSTLHILSTEVVGRANLGDGLLTVYGPEIQVTLVIDPYKLSPITEQQLIDIFTQMANREVKSIFEELGLPKPNRDLSNINPDDVSLDKVMPDRRALDKVIFEALGLTEEEQLEVYKAVVELVKQRLAKAKTFSNKKKK